MSPWDSVEVERHLPAMRRYARALAQDGATADDLVQQALLRAYERAGTFRLGAPLLPWLLAILHNVFLSHVRRGQVERRALAELSLHNESRTPAGGPDAGVQLAELGQRFAALSETHRAVLHLVVVEGLSYRETAEALDLPVGTVMSRLNRARAALRAPDVAGDHATLRIVGGRDAE